MERERERERERVSFNQTNWDEIVGKLYWFWQNYVGPNIAKGALCWENTEKWVKKHIL